MELVLATRNKKKVEEIRRITEGLNIDVVTLDNFPECPEVKEDGATFMENAVKKAVAVARYTGKVSLADDSGLEVDALNGAPGIMSARYAGNESDDSKNIGKLLREMENIPLAKRSARFACCLALAYPDGRVLTFLGYSYGMIGKEPAGFNGFGYDPVFYPEGYERTFAEISGEEKDAISHRGRALSEFGEYLRGFADQVI
jgi:XTP/dITP diphosphohydrolase